MKKIISITAIIIALLATKSHAQTITAQGRVLKLNRAQISFLLSRGDSGIKNAIKTGAGLRNSDTADRMLLWIDYLTKKQTAAKLLIASK